jgi:hypothetical protein
MSSDLFRYQFIPSVPSGELEATLVLAILATESLHGVSQVRLDAAHAFDADRRICIIDARSEVGRDLNRLFVGFVTREFGDSAFEVRRVDEGTRESVAEHPVPLAS